MFGHKNFDKFILGFSYVAKSCTSKTRTTISFPLINLPTFCFNPYTLTYTDVRHRYDTRFTCFFFIIEQDFAYVCIVNMRFASFLRFIFEYILETCAFLASSYCCSCDKWLLLLNFSSKCQSWFVTKKGQNRD